MKLMKYNKPTILTFMLQTELSSLQVSTKLTNGKFTEIKLVWKG